MNIHQGEQRQQAHESFENQYNDTKKQIRKNFKMLAYFFFALILIFILSNAFYVVREDEVATVREFGEIKRVVVDADNVAVFDQNLRNSRFENVIIDTNKGLKFKIPFITTVDKDTAKLLTYISNVATINTRDKIRYQINMYAQWQIVHPGIFRSALGTVSGANEKIDEITYAVVIDRINRLNSTDFLANKDALNEILESAKNELNENLASQGIALVDIDVYRTILPPSNIESTYKKMIAEREAIAQQIRSEGMELYQNTVADTDRNVANIMANAIEESEKIRGDADATALEIYANGFSKDPDFYEFWRTLKSYEATIDSDTVLYIDRNNEYLKFFSTGR